MMKGKTLEEKKVVTCFLESGGEVLILRRSERVGSYRGRWAGVSGYVDTTPDEQALIEIKEETGLQGEDIEFVRKGQPLEVEDKDMGVRWLVHPYLFRVLRKDRIRIDWEHKEFRWIKPGQLFRYRTVPMLREAFERVRR